MVEGSPRARRGGEKGRWRAVRCSTTQAEPRQNPAWLRSVPKLATATVHRALEAHARRDGEVVILDQALPISPGRDTVARQGGLPMDGETGFRRCFPLPPQFRGLPRVRASPLPYDEAKHRAFRERAGKLLPGRRPRAYEHAGPLGGLRIGIDLP